MTISQKLRIAQKKWFFQKIKRPVNSNLHCKFGHFGESWIFERPKRPFWTPVAPKPEVMWNEILRTSLFLAYCASFMSRWPLLRGCLHILNCDRAFKVYNFVALVFTCNFQSVTAGVRAGNLLWFASSDSLYLPYNIVRAFKILRFCFKVSGISSRYYFVKVLLCTK